MRQKIEATPNHNSVHGYIGGTIGSGHTAFEDPFVFLLHSNVDRLWAMWQTVPGEEWRLDPELTYGNESSNPTILENLEPWAGGSGLRPWAPPDNQQVVKTSKHPSVVAPPCHDTLPTFVPVVEVVNSGNVINFNDVPEGETTARAASFRIYGCRDVDLRVKAGTEPSSPFSVLTPGGVTTVVHEPGEFVEGRIWFGFTGQTPLTSETPQNVTIELVSEGKEFDFTLTANSIEREEVAVVLALDQSGSMNDPAGTTGSARIDLLKEAASEFVDLIQANNGVGLIRFDHDAYEVGHATYPGFPVTRITTDSNFDSDRIAARGAVNAHATNVLGATSIGDGVLMARNTVNPVTGYDRKALIVFTDGIENRSLAISDVLGSIDERTFAIGLGNAQQVSTAAEYGIPVERRARVRAETRRPDATSTWIDLDETEPGIFEGGVSDAMRGVYRFRVVASGLTLKGRRFTREQLLTGAALQGGDGPFPFGGADPKGERDDLCRLLECLIATGALKEFSARNGIEPELLLRCMKELCEGEIDVAKDEHRGEAKGLAWVSGLVRDPRFVEAVRAIARK